MHRILYIILLLSFSISYPKSLRDFSFNGIINGRSKIQDVREYLKFQYAYHDKQRKCRVYVYQGKIDSVIVCAALEKRKYFRLFYLEECFEIHEGYEVVHCIEAIQNFTDLCRCPKDLINYYFSNIIPSVLLIGKYYYLKIVWNVKQKSFLKVESNDNLARFIYCFERYQSKICDNCKGEKK